MLALGIDIAEQRLDTVLLDSDRQLVGRPEEHTLASVRKLLDEIEPDVIAIDSPSGWSRTGSSRAAERDLHARGIHLYWTPAAPTKNTAWIVTGIRAFEIASEAGYPLYARGPSVHRQAIEVYPHASVAALTGTLPITGSSPTERAWRKLTVRLEALGRHGVRDDRLRTLHHADAALGALTGLLALEGVFAAAGDPDEGVIVVPTRSLPRRFTY